MSWYGLDVDISVCPSGEEQDRSKRMGKSDEYHLRGSRTKRQASVVAQLVKNPPALRETWVSSLGWEDPLENGTATHSSILAWKVHGVAKSWTRLSHFHTLRVILWSSMWTMCHVYFMLLERDVYSARVQYNSP